MLPSLKEFFNKYTRDSALELFKETCTKPDYVIFNKTHRDDKDTYSFRKQYLRFYDDPTEVSFVDNVLGGRFDLLETIKKAPRLKSLYASVRLEAEQRRVYDQVEAIKEIANDPANKSRFAALRYLSDNSFVEKDSPVTRGRISNVDKAKAAEEYVRELSEDEKDFQALKLN